MSFENYSDLNTILISQQVLVEQYGEYDSNSSFISTSSDDSSSSEEKFTLYAFIDDELVYRNENNESGILSFVKKMFCI